MMQTKMLCANTLDTRIDRSHDSSLSHDERIGRRVAFACEARGFAHGPPSQ